MRSVLDRNLIGTILCCREVAAEMIERKTGRILTIGSIAGCVGRPAADDVRVVGAGAGRRAADVGRARRERSAYIAIDPTIDQGIPDGR